MRALPSTFECDQRISHRQDDLQSYFMELSAWLVLPRAQDDQEWAEQCFNRLSEALDRFVDSNNLDFSPDADASSGTVDNNQVPKHIETAEFTCLEDWLQAVGRSISLRSVYELLSKFQKMDWADEERALMSKTYIVHIDRLSKNDSLLGCSQDMRHSSNIEELRVYGKTKKPSKKLLYQLAVEQARLVRAKRLDAAKDAWWTKD